MTHRINLPAAAWVVTVLFLGMVAPVIAAPVIVQVPDDPLPAGPGKDAVIRVCTACHDATQFAYVRHTPEAWDNEISKMQSAGAEMTAEDQIAISAYLAENLPEAAPPAAR